MRFERYAVVIPISVTSIEVIATITKLAVEV